MKSLFSFQKAFFLFAVLFLNKGFSQNSYIETKKNGKISINDNSFEVFPADNIIEYKPDGNSKKETIKFKEIESALLGNYRLSRIKIENNDDKLYFLIVETSDKKLVGYNNLVTSSSINPVMNQNTTRTNVAYTYFVINKENKVLEKLEFTDVYGDKPAQKREEVEQKIKSYFSKCPELMGRLAERDVKDIDFSNASKTVQKAAKRYGEGKANVPLMFNNPKYSNCTLPELNEVRKEVVENNSSTTDFIKDQNFTFGYVTTEIGTTVRDIALKGTLSIKNSELIVTTRDNSTTMKIVGYQDGVYKCSDRNMIHFIKILPENGKIKSYSYNTKISFTADLKMGGTTSYYLANKAP